MSQGMSFDYNAPAELFLAKRTKNSREKSGALQQRLRPSVTPSKLCERPKPSANGLRWGMSASAVAKSEACTKPMSTRCVNLSDRASARTSSQRN